MSLNPHKNFVNIIILKRLTKKHPQKYIYSAQVRFEVVIDIIGEMKCCSQFQQIIQMSYITSIISGGTWFLSTQWVVCFSPSLVVWDSFITGFYPAFWYEWYQTDINWQARNINSEHKTVYIMTCSLYVYLLLKFLSILNCLHFTLASCIEQNTFCKIFSNSSFSVHQKTFRQINVDFTPLVIQ